MAASVLAIRRGRLGAAGIVLAAGALVAALAALSTRALWTKRSRTSGEITSPQRLPSGPSGPDRAEAIAHWNDAEGALWAAGFRAEPVASPTAFADSLAPELDRDAGAALRRLADVATWAYFSAPGSPVPRLGDAERDVRTVVAAARGLGTPPKRGSVRTGA